MTLLPKIMYGNSFVIGFKVVLFIHILHAAQEMIYPDRCKFVLWMTN